MTPKTPWFTGVLCGAMAALLVGALISSLGLALLQINVAFAVVIVGVVLFGAGPTVLRYRSEPVGRWLSHGAMVGAAVAVSGLVLAAIF